MGRQQKSMWGHSLRCIVLCLCVCVVSSVADASKPKVVSAADFMRSLHLQPPPHNREPGESADLHGDLGEGATVGHTPPHKRSQKLHNTQQLKRDLSKLDYLSSEPISPKKRAPRSKPTPAQLKRDLESAKQHFPETEKQISVLQTQIQRHEAASSAASKLSAATHKKVQEKVAEMNKIEAKREYDLMTDPHAEKIADQAEESLQHLKALADGYGKKAEASMKHVKHLHSKLAEKMHERQINIKAVQLFHHFKKSYEAKLSGKVAKMSTQFHDKAMGAALRLAKKKFQSFKKKFLAKESDQQSAEVRELQGTIQQMKLHRKKRQAERAKRRARMAAKMAAKEESDARLLFQKYVSRFHESEQEESTRELQAELDMEDQN